MVQIMEVIEFPDRACCKIRVSFESLKFMNYPLEVLTICPAASRLNLSPSI
jgi:hypothetical protein